MPIRAGTQVEINALEGDWLFIDLGFHTTNETCGVLKILNPEAEEALGGNFTFGYTVDVTTNTIHERVRTPLNLVLEAPLSMTFGNAGNPITRACDTGNGPPRPWTAGAAPIVTVSAISLLTKLRDAGDAGIEREVRLFEGFVSGRPNLDHVGVCRLLRDAVWQRQERQIFVGDEIKQNNNDNLLTILWILGMGPIAVPPVIRPNL
ncbi:MAG: hypothetical protein J4G13_09675 [Dehalococcoidia bacterium]|nr:hypothetical protein [Dehalococcoidia bacterium]